MNDQEILAYNNAQTSEFKQVCELLMKEIDNALPQATSYLYHGSPAWFLDENPIVGYYVTKRGMVGVLFWSGQSFDEPLLLAKGKHKAAEMTFTKVEDVDVELFRKILEKAKTIQWNYKDIRENKGKLTKLL